MTAFQDIPDGEYDLQRDEEEEEEERPTCPDLACGYSCSCCADQRVILMESSMISCLHDREGSPVMRDSLMDPKKRIPTITNTNQHPWNQIRELWSNDKDIRSFQSWRLASYLLLIFAEGSNARGHLRILKLSLSLVNRLKSVYASTLRAQTLI